MKTTIDQHKTFLTNMRAHLAEDEVRLARMQANVDRIRAQIETYAGQITEAERRGLESFDDNRFMKPRTGAKR